jgi:hypothetical protein
MTWLLAIICVILAAIFWRVFLPLAVLAGVGVALLVWYSCEEDQSTRRAHSEKPDIIVRRKRRLIMRIGWAILLALGSACTRHAPVAADARSAEAFPFHADRAAADGEAAMHLSGQYYIHHDEIEVVISSGYLELNSTNRRLRDVPAGIASGATPFSGGWNTPRLSSVHRARDLALAPDGSVRDTIRFIIKGIQKYPLADYWLAFQLHSTFYSSRAGMWAEEVRWIHEERKLRTTPSPAR